MPKTKKIFTLDLDLDFLDNVCVLGIQAPLLELHRLAYFLNEYAQWDLARIDDYSPWPDDGMPWTENMAEQAYGQLRPEEEPPVYALLQHTLPVERLNVFLLENKNPEPLVREEDCDYFLMACGETAHYDFETLIGLLENIESVFSVYPIDIRRHDGLKNFFLKKDRFPEI
ncbi:MAG: hypothetical protein K2O01_07310 [Bacteroidales bacterium]|nr:hypothetical protein [Bacteroidales bacterium]